MTKFWLESFSELLTSYDLIPTENTTLEHQMNSVTRAVIFVWVGLRTIGYKNNVSFLLNSLVFIIILYYIQRNMSVESYTETLPLDEWRKIPASDKLRIQNPNRYRFCMDDKPINFDQSYVSKNQQLVGPPNPKTLQAPVIVPPAASFDYWCDPSYVPYGINGETTQDVYLSGYQSFDNVPSCDVKYPYIQSPYLSPVTSSSESIENFQQQRWVPTQSDGHDWVNREGVANDLVPFTYNQKQLIHNNIPSNYPAGQCSMNPVFNEYNRNMYTNILQPGEYNRIEVIEPVQSNMGISFQQQFEPITYEPDKGGMTWVSHDPRLSSAPNKPPLPSCPPMPNNNDIYDPRSGGYGTSYRTYIDPLTGQPRFYYDDIDAIRRPNYITRTNIDHLPWADKYGPMSSSGHVNPDRVRELANAQFHDGSLQLRGELQERAMRKYNSEVAWQRRQFPIHNGGGMNLAKS